jgi:hypothetical protein
LISSVLDFDVTKPDQAFLDLLKNISSDFIGETIDGLSSDFQGGQQAAIQFMNIAGVDGLKVIGGEMGDMMAMMGGSMVTKYITEGYQRYQDMKFNNMTRA